MLNCSKTFLRKIKKEEEKNNMLIELSCFFFI